MRRPKHPAFPHDLGDGVFRLGHNAESSFGAHAYFVQRTVQGQSVNLMIDSPRWMREVHEPVNALGGLQHILLTHWDDVADAERYAQHFGSKEWIYHDDRGAAPYADRLIEGGLATEVVPGVVAFPVPGHTKGSVLFHVDGHLLFSGDSLAWDERRERLTAFRDACW